MGIVPVLALMMGCSPAPEVPASDPAAAPPQTVVLVILCTLRAERLGIHGNEHEPTPYMDALARAGTRFERMLASAPWTRPSIAALTTGLHPVKLGIDDEGKDAPFEHGVPPEATTLAEQFRDAGWATVGATANPNANRRVGMAQGFGDYHDTSAKWRKGEGSKTPGIEVVDAFLESAAKVQGPLFGQLVTVDTHRPLEVQPMRRLWLGYAPWGESLLGDYDSALNEVDEAVARLDAGLAAQGRQDRLLVIVGDHGEGLYTPKHAGRSHASWLYEANLHVPWIVHGPGAAAGHVVQGLATSVDVPTTLLDLVGLPPVPDVAGRSFADAVRGKADRTPRTDILSVTRFGPANKARMTTPDWVYIRNYKRDGTVKRGNEELYAGDDVEQRKNVVRQHPEEAKQLRKKLETARRITARDEITWQPESSREDLEQLEALGYVDGHD